MSVREVVVGCLKNWHGLGPTTLQELAASLVPVTSQFPPEVRYRTYQRFLVHVFERPEPPRLVEAWCSWETAVVSIVEYDEPPVCELDGVLAAYGEPERVLPDCRYVVGARVYDRVYPSRGITLSVAEHFATSANPIASHAKLVHVQLFAPCTIETYITDIATPPGAHPHAYPPNR